MRYFLGLNVENGDFAVINKRERIFVYRLHDVRRCAFVMMRVNVLKIVNKFRFGVFEFGFKQRNAESVPIARRTSVRNRRGTCRTVILFSGVLIQIVHISAANGRAVNFLRAVFFFHDVIGEFFQLVMRAVDNEIPIVINRKTVIRVWRDKVEFLGEIQLFASRERKRKNGENNEQNCLKKPSFHQLQLLFPIFYLFLQFH